MSIQHIIDQFKAEVAGKVKVERVTMKYVSSVPSDDKLLFSTRTDDKIQRFTFRVSKNKGATTEIDVECDHFMGIPEAVKVAAHKAIVWVEGLE